MQDFQLYYSHLISAIGGGKELNGLINDWKHQVYQHRSESHQVGYHARELVKQFGSLNPLV